MLVRINNLIYNNSSVLPRGTLTRWMLGLGFGFDQGKKKKKKKTYVGFEAVEPMSVMPSWLVVAKDFTSMERLNKTKV